MWLVADVHRNSLSLTHTDFHSNEKIDVYSFGMCLVELVDGNVPWHGYASSAEVPYKVAKPGQRPHKQLSSASPEIKMLIETCWIHDATSRPSFPEIVETLQQQYCQLRIAVGGSE